MASIDLWNAINGRGRHRRPRRRPVLTAAVVALPVAAVVGVLTVDRGASGTDPSTATDPTTAACTPRELSVGVAPQLTAVVREVAADLPCLRVSVTPQDPATVADRRRRGQPAATDVWIPDSSAWLAAPAAGPKPGRGSAAPLSRGAAVSIAHSPVVLALPDATARRLGASASFEGVARTVGTDRPVRLQAGRLGRSAAAQAAVLGLLDATAATPTTRGNLAALLRSAAAGADRSGELPGPGAVAADPTAYVTTEQAVWSVNDQAGRTAYRAVYAPAPGHSLDYPYVVLSDDPATRETAGLLRDRLTGPEGRAALLAAGFRTPDGRAGAALTGAAGVDSRRSTAAPLSAEQAATARRVAATLMRHSRMLALVDVSGSMTQMVPGTMSTRIGLVRTVMGEAIGLLPEGTVAGLWQFSSDLTPSTNYEQVAPMMPVTAATRPRLGRAVAALMAEPGGGTGLYDSVLAAVRYVRSTYDPHRVNSVIVLSDGRNEYASAHGITLDALTKALRAEADPDRPVVVISVAYGPDSDTAALRRISELTGGATFVARDPRELPVIFREAIGQRVCTGVC